MPAPLSFRNFLRANGGLEVWQRGAGASASIAVAASQTQYCPDRWYYKNGANQASVVSAQAGLTPASRLSARIIRNSGQTGTGTVYFAFPFDTEECYAMRGKLLALSFVVSTGANWSPTNGTLTCNVYVGTGAAAKRNSSALTGETNPLTGSVDVAAGAIGRRVVMIASKPVQQTTTQAELQFSWAPTGTAGAADSVTIDDVQLEAVDSYSDGPTEFERLTFANELALCQRHYAKTFPYGTAPAQSGGVAGALGWKAPAANATIQSLWQFPVQMRIAPTITTYNPSAANSKWRDVTAGTDKTESVDPSAAISADRVLITNITDSPAAADLCYIHAQADAGI